MDSDINKRIIGRRDFLKIAGVAGVTLMSGSLPFNKKRGVKPNIIIILADDIGYGDLGVYGCKDIPTPGIDSIARNGILFKNAYVSSPLCSPTRAGLMTGRYQQRFGYEFNVGPPPGSLRQQVGLPLEETTLAETLREKGYSTGIIGKWHLGMLKKYNPLRHGFDSFFGFMHGDHKYFDERNNFNPILRNYSPLKENEYLTDAFTREALKFIDNTKEKPFFLYLPYSAGHTPLQAPEKYLKRFEYIKNKKRRIYAAMISAMDDGVKLILKKLNDNGILENTVIFFLNDNGGPIVSNASRNYPLRGGKNSLHEGGIRVPYLMQWKGKIPENIEYDGLVSSLDIFPTAVFAAEGIESINKKIDGVNIIPFITNKKNGDPHSMLFWRGGRHLQYFAVRKGKWKLLLFGNKRKELFDISVDLGEQNNIIEKYPDIALELEDLIIKWNSQIRKPLWKIPKIRKRKRIGKELFN